MKSKKVLKQLTIILSICAVASTVLIACGGGGGGSANSSGRPPVAPPPVCSAAVTAQVPTPGQVQPKIAAGDPRIAVPWSSIPRPGFAHTNHLILASSLASPSVSPSGLSPSKVRAAYNITTSGSGAIAIVDAYDDANALSDFNVFSTQFGLPTESSSNATSSSNAVFQVVYASGSKPSADASGGWQEEVSLDIEWAHAMAPAAKIYLVEAATSSVSDLMAAVNVAKTLSGVKQVSMSFGVQFNTLNPETGCYYVDYDSTFLHSGVTFFASSGDTAAEHDYPALSSNVTAVGGTTLNLDGSGNWLSETVWNGTGGGDSTVEPRPVYQDGVAKKVGRYRRAFDIAAVAHPNTGVAV